MNILGISAFVHDSAACLIRNGKLIANVEEERLNRIKHTDEFPVHSVNYVLAKGGIQLSDVDAIAFNWNPKKSLLSEIFKVVTLPISYFKIAKYNKSPKNFKSIAASLRLKRTFNELYPNQFKGEIYWIDHHLAHAASSYYLSPFNTEAADVIVIDGHGDDCSASVFAVKENVFLLKKKIPIFDSLGIIYTNFTNFLGFENYQEGKTMALASFGKNTFKDVFQKIIGLKSDGSWTVLDKSYLGLWNYLENRLDRELGKKRGVNEPLTQRHFDIAFSMQQRVKEAILHLIHQVSATSGHKNLALCGGVFLNCDINKEILDRKLYPNMFIPPFTSDTGGAAGAGLYAAYVLCKESPVKTPHFSPYLGPDYSNVEILKTLQDQQVDFEVIENPWEKAAEDLQNHRVIGWFQGRMECGPRALGNRSILANPTSNEVREYLNITIKKREDFRPFAPIVTTEAALKFFDLCEPISELTRYMLVTTTVRTEYRDKLPGITHVDGTARIQIVTEESNPEIYRLLLAFEELSGFAVLINTSFNRHEPIVCSPNDALNCFQQSGLDSLFVGNYLVRQHKTGINTQLIYPYNVKKSTDHVPIT
jgi:carbamoyltransferase